MCADALMSDDGKGRAPVKHAFWLSMMGRLKPGWTEQRATAHLHALSPGITRATVPPMYKPAMVEKFLTNKIGASAGGTGVSGLRRRYEQPLWVLLATTGLVVLIARESRQLALSASERPGARDCRATGHRSLAVETRPTVAGRKLGHRVRRGGTRRRSGEPAQPRAGGVSQHRKQRAIPRLGAELARSRVYDRACRHHLHSVRIGPRYGNKLARVLNGQRPEADGVHQFEDGSVGADSERQRRDGDSREPWALSKLSQTVCEFLQDARHMF
jgi:hypothetical protein